MVPRLRGALIVATVLVVSSCATFENSDGSEAPFSRLGHCRALARWVEPVKTRHGARRSRGWNETTTRERTKFLFTDPYFVPIFGTPVDALDGGQVAAIRKALAKARSTCTDEAFLQSMYPDIFLARAFDPRLPLTPFSRSFVVAHAAEQRAVTARSGRAPSGAERERVRRVQRQLAVQGFDAGLPDGVSGVKTRSAVIAYKRAKAIRPTNGDITPEVIAKLEGGDADGTPSPATKPAARPRREREGRPSVASAATPTASASSASGAREHATVVPQDAAREPTSGTSRPPRSAASAPETLAGDTVRLRSGETIALTPTNLPFLAGVSAALLQACENPRGFAERAELTRFVMSTGVLGAGGNRYSDDNIGRSVASGLRSQALFTSGEKAGGLIPCSDAERVTDTILRSLRADSAGADGSRSTFVGSCVASFDERRCRCLADAGRTVMPDIHRQRYDRAVIPTIISRNPLVGMQIVASCGIVNY